MRSLAFSGKDIASLLPDDLPLCPAGASLDLLAEYLRLLRSWNRALNLVGFDEPERIVRELFMDSFYLAAFLDRVFPGLDGDVWDPGAGAGLPGIPLRIVWQKGRYSMLEAREKRALFLENVLARLKLPGTFALRIRAEKFLAGAGRKAQCVVSRAFMPWPELLRMFGGHVSRGLVFLANEPAPGPCLASLSYMSAGKKRWIWALAPVEQ